ncbi:MAG: hypothetical protein GY814_10835, partial [Gammaproteobacteria bacterium]|nr:hypothetical protein [Gammaproteobacteria bacterium]
ATGVAACRLYRDSSLLVELNALSHVDINLAALNEYSYSIAAVDLAGNVSAQSVAVAVIMPEVPTETFSLDVRITTGNDDVEEGDDGRMSLSSSDLELVDESGMGSQLVGLLFRDLQLPAGAVISNAYLEFETDEVGVGTANLQIQALAADNQPLFSSVAYDLSSRSRAAASVAWNDVEAWSAVNGRHQSPDISALVQLIVNRSGWLPGNNLGLVISGSGTRTAESYNGERNNAPQLHVEYYIGDPVNQPPVVDAGSDAVIVLPTDSLMLIGLVFDDGLTDPAAASNSRSQLSGPVAVAFADSAALSTVVTFSQSGVYQLQLSANDGEFSATDTLTVTVTEPDAEPPSVPADLSASPAANGNVSLSWGASADNTAVASYNVYRFGVLIGATDQTSYVDTGRTNLQTYDYAVASVDVAGNVSPLSAVVSVEIPELSLVIETRVSTGNDDSEEGVDGAIQLNSSDLELVDEVGQGNQMVGIRFRNVEVPVNAVISRAYIEFEVDEVSSGAVALTITVEDTANAAVFSAASFDISNRPVSANSVFWDVSESWAVNEIKQTADLTILVQEIVSRPDWVSGAAVSFIITGTGTKTVESYNGERNAAPRLHIEYH